MIELRNVTKEYSKGHAALNGVSVKIERGEFVFIVGDSGSGKSTLIKLIMKELNPTEGTIIVNGQNLNRMKHRNIAKYRRGLGVVFQDFRLLKDRNIYENIAFALRVTETPTRVIKKKVPAALSLVGLAQKYKSFPKELSGGEQQRVAIARAIVNEPKVLLLDEPLSNLDAKLRVKMREEIREIQKKYEITMVFVTHDQEEAMVLGDQIAIMDQGKLVQIGKPEEVYLHPQNDFARDFLGISNRFTDIHGNTICCRPEELEFAAEGSVKGIVRQEEFLGFYRQYYVETMNHEHIIVRTDRNIKVEEGKEVQLRVK